MTFKKVEMNTDPRELQHQMFNLVRDITSAALVNCETQNPVEILGVGLAAIAGALSAVTPMVGQREGIGPNSPIEDMKSTINTTSTLVTALLAAKSHRDNGDTVTFELNPIVYLAAIKAAEEILRRAPDNMLNPGMVYAARRWENENGYEGWNPATVIPFSGERPSYLN